MKYRSTKTYGHEVGLSACFRQWRASSHCNQLHGYALAFRFEFGANTLDDRNWVIDFGGLKSLKERLVGLFDHTLVIAHDDPQRQSLMSLDALGLATVHVLPNVGCESFAWVAYNLAKKTLAEMGQLGRVQVLSCECSEHGANSAIYVAQQDDFVY